MKLLNLILISVFISFISTHFIVSRPTNLTPVSPGAIVWTVQSFNNAQMNHIYQHLGVKVSIRKIGHNILIEGLCNQCHADIDKPCHFVCTQYVCDQNSMTILQYLTNILNADSFGFLHNHNSQFFINGTNGNYVNVICGTPSNIYTVNPAIGNYHHYYNTPAVGCSTVGQGCLHQHVPVVTQVVTGCAPTNNGCGLHQHVPVVGCATTNTGQHVPVVGCATTNTGCGLHQHVPVVGCATTNNGCGLHQHVPVVGCATTNNGCGFHQHVPVVGCATTNTGQHVPVAGCATTNNAFGHHHHLVAAGINNLLNNQVVSNVSTNPYLGCQRPGVETTTITTVHQHSHSHLTGPLPTTGSYMYLVKSFSDGTLNHYYSGLRRRIKLYIHDGRAKIIGGWNSCWTSSLNHPAFMCRRNFCTDHSSQLESALVADLTQSGFQFMLHNNSNNIQIQGPNGSYVILQSIPCSISHGCSRTIGY